MTIEKNIADRQAAESLHRTIGELLREEVPRLPSDEARGIFWRMVRESAEKNLPRREPLVTHFDGKESPLTETDTTELPPEPPDVAEALEIIDEMEELAMEIPDAGQDFAADVLEKARSIGRTIERSNSVTQPQMEALENMCSGLARWIRD